MPTSALTLVWTVLRTYPPWSTRQNRNRPRTDGSGPRRGSANGTGKGHSISPAGGLSVRALWELLFVLHRAILDLVAPNAGRIGKETKPFVEPIQSPAAQEATPVKKVTENSLPEVSTQLSHQP